MAPSAVSHVVDSLDPLPRGSQFDLSINRWLLSQETVHWQQERS